MNLFTAVISFALAVSNSSVASGVTLIAVEAIPVNLSAMTSSVTIRGP